MLLKPDLPACAQEVFLVILTILGSGIFVCSGNTRNYTGEEKKEEVETSHEKEHHNIAQALKQNEMNEICLFCSNLIETYIGSGV